MDKKRSVQRQEWRERGGIEGSESPEPLPYSSPLWRAQWDRELRGGYGEFSLEDIFCESYYFLYW